MKKLFTIAVLFIVVSTQAQSKLVKYFKKLSTENKHGLTLTEKAGKITATSGTGKCRVTHDAKKGYMQIIDDGTGGGQLFFEMATYKDAKGKEYLVTSCYVINGDVNSNEGNGYYSLPNMADATYQLWPDIGYIEDILPSGVTKDDIEPYKETEYNYNVLQKDGTILMYTGFVTLDGAANSGDEKAIALRKKLKPAKLVWNKATASFDLK